MRKRSGFTIVELLVVIVIIAVLAALVITLFNGITVRAQRSSMQTTLNQWEKVIRLYQSTAGTLPEGDWLCVGKASDYPASGEFPAGACAVESSDYGTTWTVMYRVDSSAPLLSDELSQFVHGSVAVTHEPVTVQFSEQYIRKMRGIVYDKLNTNDNHASFTYATPGNSCIYPSGLTILGTSSRICRYSFMRSI